MLFSIEVYTDKQQKQQAFKKKLKRVNRIEKSTTMQFMKKADAIKLAGSAIKLAKILSITKGAVSHWGEDIPKGREYELRYIKPDWFNKEKEKETA